MPVAEHLFVKDDMNGHTWRDREWFEEVISVYGYGKRKEGETILSVCKDQKLKIFNTLKKT